jgi:hypothetical protein
MALPDAVAMKLQSIAEGELEVKIMQDTGR